jgi:hypothetical protein
MSKINAKIRVSLVTLSSIDSFLFLRRYWEATFQFGGTFPFLFLLLFRRETSETSETT